VSEPRVRISPHAAEQIRLRKLTIAQVVSVVLDPEQITVAAHGRYFAESRIEKNDKKFLLRVLIERVEEDELIVLIVLTVYPTSKLNKYWRGGAK
jgi:hypothetical protein